MKSNFKLLYIIGTLCLLIACKETNSSEYIASNIENTNVAIQVTMEGKTHTIAQNDLEAINVSFEEDVLLFSLYQEDNPFQVNINLNRTDLLNKGSKSFIIPDDNTPNIKVDLNFFNADRNVKRMNKRIIFRKGTIEIKQLTKHQLEMTFKGEGSGITERNKNFPITGKVNVSF